MITDELREFAGRWPSTDYRCKDMLAIADRIDKRYEEMHGFCERLYRATINHKDVTLWDVDYTTLPVDADGEYIHIGDTMDSKVDYLFDGKPFTVRAIVLCEDGWEVADGRFGNRYEPDSLHHHHAPTLEDVLREFGRGWHEQMNGPETFDIADYVERYAAKLREMLAGDGE